MKRKLIIAGAIAVVSGICLGVLFDGFINSQFDIFGSFSYVIFALYIVVIAVLGIILYIVTGPNIAVISTIFAIIMLCAATYTSKVSRRIADRNAKKLANSMIAGLYQYRDEHGQFPENIDSIRMDLSDIKKFKRTQTYIFDREISNFRIYAWYDGWYFHFFSSRDSSWHQQE